MAHLGPVAARAAGVRRAGAAPAGGVQPADASAGGGGRGAGHHRAGGARPAPWPGCPTWSPRWTRRRWSGCCRCATTAGSARSASRIRWCRPRCTSSSGRCAGCGCTRRRPSSSTTRARCCGTGCWPPPRPTRAGRRAGGVRPARGRGRRLGQRGLGAGRRQQPQPGPGAARAAAAARRGRHDRGG